jgi:transcriptional regulator
MLYNPPHFRQTDAAPLIAALADQPFATLASNGPEGPVISHLPLFYDSEGGPLGRLIGHVARANPHGKVADVALPSVAVFQGPDAYISPGWYPAKAEHGKVVPTWNYSVIHATGRLVIHDDAEWLRDAVTRLTTRHEGARVQPWAVSDAPEDFIRAQLKGIVGIELVLTAIEGKAKLSQNRNEADHAGVVEGLAGEEDIGSAGVRTMM